MSFSLPYHLLANQYFVSGAILGLDTSNAGGSFTYGNALTDTTYGQTVPLGLAKLGTGTLILTGANTYSGGTQVDGGTLEIDNTTGSGTGTGAVSVASGATLLGTGTVGTGSSAVTVASGGTLGAGTASTIGALAINGTLNLQSGSTTALRIEGTTAGVTYDQINVTGAVTLGGTLSLSYGGFTPVAGGSFELITSSTGVTGNFTSIVNPLANALTFTSSYDASDFTLSVTAIQNSFTPFAQNPNQLAVARNLNNVASDPRETALISYLNNLPGAALPNAFTELSPIQQTSVAQNSLSVSRAAFGTLENRLSAVRSGSNGLSLSQFNLIDQNIPAASLIAGTDLPTNVKAFTPAPDNRWGFFAAADGDFGDINGGSLSPDSSYHGAGFTLGSDYRVTPALALGFAAGYDWNKTDFDNSGSNVVANSIRFGPYATWKDKTGDWIDGTLGGAYHWYESARDTIGGMADSHSNGTEFDTSLKYGHDFQAGAWTLTPTFGFDYLHLNIGDYTESGSLAPLTVDEQNADSFRSNLGGTVAHAFQWKGVAWNPYVQAGWAHEFLDAADAVSARFASGAGDVFTTQGQSIGHDSATFGAGLQATLTDAVTANLSYSGEANGQYQDHSFDVSVRVQF